MERLFCATVYVKNENHEFLLMHHRKLNKWTPPGGKIDPNEIPDDAALRETFEETGLKVKLLGKRVPVEGGLLTPEGMQLNVVTEGVREHIDFIYFATPLPGQTAKLNEREAYDIGWFSIDEVKKLDSFDSVPKWCELFTERYLLPESA